MIDVEKTNDPEALRSVCRAYEASHRVLTERLESLAKRLAELEGVEAAQAALDLPDLEIGQAKNTPAPCPDPGPRTAPEEAPRKPRRGHGPTPQPKLPTEIQEHRFAEPPDCPACGGEMKMWPGQFEQSEEITVVETQFKVLVHQRAKYRCSCHGSVVTAPGPAKLIPGGRYSLDFAIHSAIEKFCFHMPTERQVRRMAQHGLEMSSQALWDQQVALADCLEPTWEALAARILTEDILHADEAGWKMMGSKTKSKWTLFGLTTPTMAVYHLSMSKSTAVVQDLLSGFEGILVVDGYKVYPIVAKMEKTIRIAHCWAHADRKFKDAKDPPASIAEIRDRIAKLYEIEREVEGPFPGPKAVQAKRHALRQEKSRPLIEDLRATAFGMGGLRKSDFGKALRYLLKHWDGLTVFLDAPVSRSITTPPSECSAARWSDARTSMAIARSVGPRWPPSSTR